MTMPLPPWIRLSGLYFFYFAYIGVLMVYLPKILIERGLSAFEIGLLYAVIPLMRFIVPFLFWRWLRLDARFFFGALWGFWLSVILLIPFIDSFAALLLIHLLMGVTTSVIPPYGDTVALQELGKERYGKVRLFGSLGFVFTVWFLASRFLDWDTVSLYLVLVSGLAVAFGYGVGRIPIQEEECVSLKECHTFTLKGHASLWISILFFQLSFGGFYNFFTVYGMDNGFNALEMSHLWIFGVVCEVVMLWFQTGIMKRFSLLTLIQFSIWMTVIRWALLSIFPGEAFWWYLAQSMHAFSFALYHTAMIGYLFSLYTPKKLAQQFYSGIGYGIGMFAGSILAGALYGPWLFLCMGGFALLSGLALYWHGRVVW